MFAQFLLVYIVSSIFLIRGSDLIGKLAGTDKKLSRSLEQEVRLSQFSMGYSENTFCCSSNLLVLTNLLLP